MDSIIYNGKEYPTRTFFVDIPDWERKFITISVDSLADVLGPKLDTDDGELEEEIDNGIYFYVSDDEIRLDADYICKNLLDTEIIYLGDEEI